MGILLWNLMEITFLFGYTTGRDKKTWHCWKENGRSKNMIVLGDKPLRVRFVCVCVCMHFCNKARKSFPEQTIWELPYNSFSYSLRPEAVVLTLFPMLELFVYVYWALLSVLQSLADCCLSHLYKFTSFPALAEFLCSFPSHFHIYLKDKEENVGNTSNNFSNVDIFD